MQDSGPKIPLRIENLGEVLSKKLENEAAILEALLVALAKGQALPEFWQRLHDAALRDDRLAELAFAYERISQDRRLRVMPAQAQATVALHAADFFAECFGDFDGASASLERVLALVPGHPEAYEKLVAICERRRDKDKLIQLHLGMASPKADKETQLEHLRKALELSTDGDEDRTVKIAQQILRIDPADEQAIAIAEHRLLAAARFSDVAKMLEQALASASVDADAALQMRVRLIELYDTKLAEIERAVPHVEEVLLAMPSHEPARKAANRLLTHKVMAPRAAAALERVYETEGDAGNVARMLSLQIEQLRGPKKTEAQKRLAKLHLDLGDAGSALPFLEAVVLADGADEEARQSYVECCVALAKLQDAARVLARAAAGAKDPGLRGRVNADLARVYIELGDVKRAKTVLVNVLDTAADDAAVLAASRAILPLYEEGKEARQAAIALEKLAQLEPETEARARAWTQLAALAERDLDDAEIAINALRNVMEIAPTIEARDGLERLYEATEKHAELADLLEGRATSLGSSEEAREVWMRVARLRDASGDRVAAIAALQQVVATFGPSREAHALLIPLLEHARKVPELLETLAAEATLTNEEERAPILLKIAQTLARQGETERALAAFAEVLALSPKDPAARAFVERAMKEGSHRLAASDILVPIYDGERDIGGLVTALEVRADLSESPADKLTALEDATALAVSHPNEQARGLELAGRGLELAVATDPSLVLAWVGRVEALVATAGAEAVAHTLVAALANRPIDSAAIARLARAAGAALVECGDSKQALEIYRALLVYEPQNHELLSTVDSLLEEQGSPADRVRLYETALERHSEPARRRELFHKIGAVQRRDLGEVRAAVDTYRRALAEFPDDKAFRGALYAAYEAAQAWDELYTELAQAAETATPDERPQLERRLAEVSLSANEPERAARHFSAVLASDTDLVPVHLDAAEKLAVRLDDASLLRQVLERRLPVAESPAAEIALLDRLGTLELEKLSDPEAAARRFERAAAVADSIDDIATTLAFHERVLAIVPHHRPTLERVIAIAKAADDSVRLIRATVALIEASEDIEEQIALALALETRSEGDVARFVSLLDRLAEKAGPRLDLLAAKARALTKSDPRAAADTYLAMLTELGDSETNEAADLFESFLSMRVDAVEHHDDRRAFFAFRAGREGGAERRRVLLSWARAERDQMADPVRAAGIVAELLTQDPDDVEALELETELDLTLERFDGAASALRRRIGLSEGQVRHALSIELMDLLLDKLQKPEEALDVAAPLLEETPSDVAAQRAALRALESASSAVRAISVLGRAADQLEESEERAKLYESLLAAPSSAPELTVERPVLFDKLLACLKDAPDRALAIALRAVGEYPGEDALWDRAERLAREAKQPDRVAMAYRQTLVHAATRLTPDVAMQIGQRGVDFQEEWFDDPDAVTHMLKLVVDVAPTATWAFERLKLVYNSGERWPDLFALYDRVIEGTEDRAERAMLLDDAAQVAKDLAGDPEKALVYLEELHKLDPSDSRTASALERLYEKHGKHKPLIDLLTERLAKAKPDAATALRLRIAQLFIDGLGELENGRKVADEVLTLDPENAEAAQALERILALTGGLKPVASDGGRLEHLLRLGGRAYQAPESRRPGKRGKTTPPPRKTTPPPPRSSVPPDSIVPSAKTPSMIPPAAVPSDPAIGTAETEVRQRAALTLRSRYLAKSQNEAAATMIEVALESPRDPVQRNELLRELIELERGPLGQAPRAFDTLALLVTLEPADRSLRKELTQVADELKNHDRLVDVLLAVSERTENEKEAIELLESASAICRSSGGDGARSISIDLRILSRSDRDPVKAKEAAKQLDKRLAEAGRDAERCGVLERLADLETDPQARGAVLHEIARLADNVLGDPARAARALRRRLEDAPEDIVALSALVDNLRAAGEHRELAQALERRVALASAPERQRHDLVELARVSANELDDREAAIAAFERVVADYGADDQVADELIALLRDGAHTERLATLLSSEADRAKDDDRASALHAALGDLHREAERPREAAQAYAHALERVPGTATAEAGLESLLGSLEGEVRLYSASVRALDDSYRATDAWEKSIALVPARLKAQETDVERATVLLEGGDLEEKRANDPGLALSSTFRAFALQPERGGVAAELLRRARLSGRWDLVAPTLLEKLEGRVVPAATARDLLVEASDWASREDADTTRVEALLEAALERRPGDVEVLARLVEARRRAPSEKLVASLLELANAHVDRQSQPEATLGSKSLESYREALTVAMRALGNRAMALDVASTLLDEAELSWSARASSADREEVAAFAESADFAIDVLAELWSAEGPTPDPRKVFAVLERGARLPFDERHKRDLSIRATDVAEPDEAIEIFRRLFDKDPHDLEIVGRLEGLLVSEGKKPEIAAIRQRQIEVARSTEDRIAMRVSLGQLLEELSDLDAAERVLLENLAEIPTHPTTVGFLARLYEHQSKTKELVALWEGQAMAQEGIEVGRAVETWTKVAVLAETDLADLIRATKARRRVVDLAPSELALDELARVLEKAGKSSDAAVVLERLISDSTALGHPLTEAKILRLASAYEAAGQRERALAWLERGEELPDASAQIRARLRHSYRAASMFEPLAALLARDASASPDPATRLSRLREAAALYSTELGQPARAIPLLEEALDLDKSDLSTRLLLSDAMRAEGRFESASEILQGLLDEYGTRRPKERALVHYELAKVSLSLGDRAKAMAELDAASKIDQGHPGILHALARLALEEGQLLRAQRTFRALLLVVKTPRGGPAREPSFATTPLPDSAAKSLESPVSRAEVLVELAAIAEKQGEDDRRTEFIDSAFEAANESAWEAEQLTLALRARGWHALTARILEERAKAATNDRDKAEILLARADVLADSLEDVAEAVTAALAALELNPTSSRAHARALELAKRNGSAARYTDVVAKLAERTNDNPELYIELALFEARTKETEFGDDAGARAAYERVLEKIETLQEPALSTKLDVLVALERVLGRLGETEAQADALARVVDLGAESGRSFAEQAEALYRLARLRFKGGPEHLDQAIDVLENAVELDPDPDHVETELRHALAALPSSLRIARRFEDHSRARDRKEALVDALVAVADRDDEPLSPLREAYDLSLELGLKSDDVDRAETLLIRIIGHAGDTEPAAWALVALGERRNAESRLLEAADLFERASRLSAVDEERQLLLRVALLADGSLADPERAIRIYESLRQREPADREIWAPLAAVYQKKGDVDSLGALLGETIPLVDDSAERARLRLSLADMILAKDADRAAALLGEVLEEDPQNARAAQLLTEIYAGSGDREKLADLLSRRLDAAKDAEDKPAVVSISLKLGQLLEEQEDENGALTIYHSVLDWEPNSREALRAIVRLGMKRDDSVGVGDELDRLLSIEEGQAAVDLAFKVAQMKRAMGDEEGAERALYAGMRARPESAELRDELVRVYTDRGATRELADLKRLEISGLKDVAAKKAGYVALAETYREKLKEPSAAAACLADAHALDPADRDVLFVLMDTWSSLGEHQKAIEAVDSAIAVDASGDASWLYFSRAVLREAIGDSDLALDDLEEAHRVSEGKYGSELRAHLEAALLRIGRDPSSSRRTESETRLRLAEVTAELGDEESARLLLGELVRRDPKDRAALRALAKLDEDGGRFDVAMSTLRRLVAIEEGADLVETAKRLAHAAASIGRPEDARAGLERALKVAPGDETIRTLLKGVYRDTGESVGLAQMLVEEARAAGDVDGRHALLVEAARYLLADETQAGRALELLDEARTLRPEDFEGQVLLALGLTASGRVAEGRTLATQLIAAQRGRRSRELGRAYYALHKAEIREGNLSEGLEALSRAFENDPQNVTMAMELGQLAVDLDDAEIAQRAFRSVTLLKTSVGDGGASARDKALAYYHLGRIADAQGDRRRAKLMLDKAISEDPELEEARTLLESFGQ